jgi:phosphoadenosine phosphosulfate reductase
MGYLIKFAHIFTTCMESYIAEIKQQIDKYNSEGKKMFATSSFQTHSLPMLHILSRIDKSIAVYFINTGYHFPDTLRFRDEVADSFGLNLIDQHPLIPKNLQKDAEGNLYFTSDPDYCCYLNKVQPLEPVLAEYDIWINGIRADQNSNRKNMGKEQPAPHNTLRYHPMLEWNNKMIFDYIKEYNLPTHPLEAKGYLSIGCEPCTRKHIEENSRGGRWFGMKKVECGLHTELVK